MPPPPGSGAYTCMERSMTFWSLWIYINNKKTQIAISSKQLMLSTSYFQHIIPHHSYMQKYNMVPCTSGVLTLRSLIPHEVQNHHMKHSNCLKFCVYVDGSCRYWLVLFINFYFICYENTAVQSLSTFPAWFASIISPYTLNRTNLQNWLAWNNQENKHNLRTAVSP